jgi:hypothetical protein
MTTQYQFLREFESVAVPMFGHAYVEQFYRSIIDLSNKSKYLTSEDIQVTIENATERLRAEQKKMKSGR